MDEKDLPSSDDSDADFVPKEDDDKSDSGTEVSDCETSDGEEKTSKTRKRKKRSKKINKKAKVTENEDDSDESKEEKKIDVDALWADFKKDVDKTEVRKNNDSSTTKKEDEVVTQSKETAPSSDQKPSLNPNKRVPPSFGNKSKVGGLSTVLNQIGKKDKMSTLQKSQLDWNKFKKSEGIEEEIKLHNRGKDGYLERQDFLQRTDLRQFEIEKDLRSARRKF